KWSLTKTESNPTSSAKHENASNSRGPNCSADALYPSFSNACSFVSCRVAPHPLAARVPPSPRTRREGRGEGSRPPLNLRQHLFAQATHLGDHRIGAVAGEIEVDIADAEIAERS